MPIPIIKTKINLPTIRQNLIPRTQITRVLSEGLQHRHKLTLISAPAGFGKTTLVSEWLVSNNMSVAWISLDESDGDPARFLTYLVASLRTLIDGVGEEVLSALRSSQSFSAESLLASLLNELSAIEENLILVLDDYHTVDSKTVDQLLNFLVEHMPPRMHLVITTREDPALPLPRLRARNQLTEVRAAELRFTETEAAEFLNQVMGLQLSADEIAALEARTEGWIAGLQLAALSMQGKQDTAEFVRSFSGANQFVLDYLLEEVLQKQPENLQGFLLRTSILSRLSGALCDALWQGSTPYGQETLEHLERANLFLIPLDNERRWYRYHHLFRDLLRQRLAQKLTKEELAQVHIRASEWFEQNEDIAEAFHHAIVAADVDRAARLVETSWQAMDESFQTGTWLGWVKQLPASAIRFRPVLCTQIGWAHMDAGNVDASESSLRDAERCLETSPHEMVVVEKEQFQTLPTRIAFARAYNAQSQDRFSDVVKYAEIAFDLMPDKDDFLHAQVSTILSGTHWANGDLDNACKLIGDWVEASKQAGNFFFAIAGAFGKADILNAQGRLRDVLQTYQQAIKLAATHNAESFTAHHHLGLGLLYHEMGEDERATQYLQKGFELGRHTTIVDWAYRKSLAQACLKESAGNLNDALEFLDEAQRFYVRTPIPNLHPVDAMKVHIYLKQNRLDKAQAWATKSGLSLHDTPDYLHEFERLTLAKIALAEYQHDQDEQHVFDVLKLLEGQLTLAQKQNRLRSQIEILILQVLAFHAKGETSKAIASLEQALALAEPEGYLRLFVNEGEPLRLLILDLRLTIEKSAHLLFGYVEKLLAEFPQPTKFQIQKSKIGNPKYELIDPLSERELEVLHLIAQGLSNQEITQKLFVALSTVKGHNLRIFAKLQAKSRTEAVARARELGLL